VIFTQDGNRRVLTAADAGAAALGLYAGMTLTQARAMVPGLTVREAEPVADRAALRRLAAWCLRYAPLVAPDPPDGVWIDAGGSAHLHGGEAAWLRDLISRLLAQGIAARAAIADTPGAAHAVARFSGQDGAVVPAGGARLALAALPTEALRLPVEITAGLRLLGFERINQVIAAPRAPLVRRFGALLATRLDQALGAVFEPIVPEVPPELVQARLAFAEPLLTAESFSAVIARLTATVCDALEKAGQGARRLDLLFERVDGSVQAIRIGTARPTRNTPHLARMLDERLERVDPGLGVEAMHLLVPHTDTLDYVQDAAALDVTALDGADARGPDLAPLIDRLANRLGPDRVWRAEPVESDVPERAVRRVLVTEQIAGARGARTRESALESQQIAGARGARTRECVAQDRQPSLVGKTERTLSALERLPLAPAIRTHRGWPADWPRPVRLLDPPQPVEAMALLPDHPPIAFTWRRVRHRIRHADGPERIAGEWWKRDGEMRAVRDYFRVEDDAGRRFWLFRRGDGTDSVTGDLRWFLHGFF